MARKSYIKELEYKMYSNFGKNYLTVNYFRNGEHNKITFILDKPIENSEKAVRKFLNS